MIGGGICGQCGVQGHNSRTCGKTHNKIKTKSKPRICGKCGLQGHNKRSCGKEKHSVKSVKKEVKIKPNTKSFICEKCGHTNIGKPKSLTPLGVNWADAASQDMIERRTKKKEHSKNNLNCDSGVSGQIVYDVKDKGVLLAKNFDDDVNIEGWYASEKWDGYRSVWNGKNFVSRTGKSFDVPDWYCSIMPPSIALDGELWLGRGKFEDCGLLRKKRPTKESDIQKWNEEWLKKEVVFNVFDIMNLNVGFEGRMEKLRTLVKDRNKCMKQLNINKPNPILAFTEQTKVNKVEALKMAKEVIKDGGEGIMLRQPGSLYEAKRSKTLYKIKEVDDMEVRIDGYKNGAGKYKGILGSFTCSLINKPDIKCNVSGMNDQIRNSYLTTHPIGTIITITYNGLTGSGKPRHPRYLRIRHQEGN
jgi:DNA ligase-1